VTIIALVYQFGIQGFFVEMRGGVVLPIAVWLAFMGKWHRRSQVTTTAEWMVLRFGKGDQGKVARYTAALTYLVITVLMVTFFLMAAAKFVAQFIGGVDPTLAAVVLAAIALAYTLASGLYGVIWTDVFQAFLIGGFAIYVAVMAFGVVPEITPEQWPGAATNTAWPQMSLDGSDWGNLFWLALLFFAAKGILEGLGGSGGSAYMAQRYYAAGSDRDTVKLSMLWAALFTFRWPMVMGFAVLAIHNGIGQDDPEAILSGLLLGDLFPAGIRGLAVAALLAASMSTFDSTINAGASYVVKDLYNPLFGTRVIKGESATQDDGRILGYARSIEPDDVLVDPKKEVYVGYAASAIIVAVGLVITLTLLQIGTGVVDIWVGIVVAFFPGFLVPFALRWFWSRFNGYGFAAGVLAGFTTSLALWLNGRLGVVAFDPATKDAFEIGLLLAASGLVSVVVALTTAPTPEATLRRFYDQIRPWGLWPTGWRSAIDREDGTRDVVRLVVALVWQVTMFLLPMLAVLREWQQMMGVAAVWSVCSLYLWFDLRRSRSVVAS
ncbi:MAG: hypothetical protein AAGI46_11525, partial [Planctomycetota bacterium]